MKNPVLFLLVFILFSCDNNQATYKPLSSGRIHSLTVVIDTEDWNSAIGNEIRKVYADEYLGLPQVEERFSLSQINYQTFSGFARTSRNVIYVNKKGQKGFSITKNKYARPQVFLEISGMNKNEIISQVKSSAFAGLKAFSYGEIVENQRRIFQSPWVQNDLKNNYGFQLTLSSAYKLFKKENNTIWFQKPTKYGTSNLIVTELKFTQEMSLKNSIKIRDSVSKSFVPGRVEKSFMITEKEYLPIFSKTSINSFDSYETRGTWEVKGDFMGGPFINYLIKDTLNNRLLYLEGFVFSPSQRKRDNIIELESIIKTLKIFKKD